MIYLSLLIPFALLFILAAHAPHGWEDENGFHLGEQPIVGPDQQN